MHTSTSVRKPGLTAVSTEGSLMFITFTWIMLIDFFHKV